LTAKRLKADGEVHPRPAILMMSELTNRKAAETRDTEHPLIGEFWGSGLNDLRSGGWSEQRKQQRHTKAIHVVLDE
jgi:hypothetical protein